MVRLDAQLLFNVRRLLDGSNVNRLKAMILSYVQAVDLHNSHRPGHETYQRESELSLRRYVLDHMAALERRMATGLRQAKAPIDKSTGLGAKSKGLDARARSATRKKPFQT
jgi:hypothetical protein